MPLKVTTSIRVRVPRVLRKPRTYAVEAMRRAEEIGHTYGSGYAFGPNSRAVRLNANVTTYIDGMRRAASGD